MKVDGGCHCGRIRQEAEVDPAEVLRKDVLLPATA